jgi:hypothetical protein
MIVSIHQPAYLPWLGYFDKIARSDVHVFLDNVQLETRGFTHRNRIKTPQGPLWLTIPVHSHGHRESDARAAIIANDMDWRGKHLKSIAQNYRKASFFSERFPRLEALFTEGDEECHLTDLCFGQLRFWLNEFGISTRIVKASELLVSGRKSDLILAYCREVGADSYLSGALGRDYLDEESFAAEGVTVHYQDYAHPVYPQLYGDFLPAMSIVDYWLNCPDVGLFGANK